MAFEPTPHPVIQIPTLEQIEACAASKKIDAGHAFAFLHKQREKIIAREREDPYRYGWEPSIWKVCDALLGLERYGIGDPEYAAAMREYLQFDKPVRGLLIMGGNRGGKSEYAANRSQKILNFKPGARAWCFHSSNQNSIEYQHPLFYRYMPKELKGKAIRQTIAYISYKQKYGFSDNKFVLPNASECSFRNYEQDIKKIEGGEIDIAWPDELVPADWVDTLFFRIATRNGVQIITFTPVEGYTPTVRTFRDGGIVVKESVAFLDPRDGLPQYHEGALAREDCDKWLTGEPSQALIPEGREFHMTPRVVKCAESTKAIVYFHTADNPFGNPEAVLDVLPETQAKIRERWYGVATKSVTARFPKFSDHHILPAASIPTGGTNYHFMDPASGRNFFMLWIRCIKEKKYVYREWPSGYMIPGIGDPGLWALPGGKKHDGRRGPAQTPFGFGLKDYKREIARLEFWDDQNECDENGVPIRVEDWDPGNGCLEKIYERYIDSRAASAPRVAKDVPVTLQEELLDIGLDCELAPGDSITEGVQLITDLISYDEEREIDFMNCSDLYISAECINLIYSMRAWTGEDGQSGACKDPIDVLRYAVLSDIEDCSEELDFTGTGGYY